MRLGIIGTGSMACQMAEAAGRLPEITLAAVLSRQAARAEKFAGAYAPEAQCLTDMAAFLETVDAVYIATPPHAHPGAIEAALMAGRAVLCEKPLTSSLAETQHVTALARREGTLLMEAIWTLCLPAYQALEQRLARLGPEAARQMVFDFSYPLAAPADSHFLDPETGGVLLDRAVYGYAAARQFLGPILSQDVFVARDARGLDRRADIRLTHAGGGTALLALSFDYLGANRLDLATTEGMASLSPSLGAEALSWKSFSGPSPAPEPAPSGLKARLKAQPFLRRLSRQKQQLGFEFHSYGASLYAPVLQEFYTSWAAGQAENPRLSFALSEEIAALVEAARQEGRGT